MKIQEFPIELEFENDGFLRRGENQSTRRKNLSEQGREPTSNPEWNPGHIPTLDFLNQTRLVF